MTTAHVTTAPARVPEVSDSRGGNGAGPASAIAGTAAEPSPPARKRRGNGKVLRKRLTWSAAGIGAVILIVQVLRPTPPAVDTAAVVRGALETTVNAEGVTRVRDRFTIAAPISGRLQRVTLREGDSVAAGVVLARITPLPLDATAAAQAEARLAAAQAALREAETRVTQTREALEQAERSTARQRRLFAEGAVTVDAMERAELSVASALREHEAAGSHMDALTAEVAVARAALLGAGTAGGRAVAGVRSPSAGHVLRVHEPSERVILAGAPLLDVGDAAALEIVIDVLSTDAVRVAPGARVRVLEWGGAGTLEARVRLVEPSAFTKVSALGVDEQRVNVIGDVLHAPASLGDGYRIQAQIVTWSAGDVLKVPNSALIRTGSGWLVFVVEAQRAVQREVRPGHRGAVETEVLAGLDEGDEVIVFPSDRIASGRKVRVTHERAAF